MYQEVSSGRDVLIQGYIYLGVYGSGDGGTAYELIVVPTPYFVEMMWWPVIVAWAIIMLIIIMFMCMGLFVRRRQFEPALLPRQPQRPKRVPPCVTVWLGDSAPGWENKSTDSSAPLVNRAEVVDDDVEGVELGVIRVTDKAPILLEPALLPAKQSADKIPVVTVIVPPREGSSLCVGIAFVRKTESKK